MRWYFLVSASRGEGGGATLCATFLHVEFGSSWVSLR